MHAPFYAGGILISAGEILMDAGGIRFTFLNPLSHVTMHRHVTLHRHFTLHRLLLRMWAKPLLYACAVIYAGGIHIYAGEILMDAGGIRVLHDATYQKRQPFLL